MTVGFLGAGKMAEAILSSMVETGLCEPWEVVACDKAGERRAYIEKQYGVVVSDDVAQTVKTCKVLVLAVKPQDLDALLAGVKGRLTEKHLLVSIVAGKTLATLKKAAGAKPRLVRVMPNLALMVQEGMSAYCAAKNAKAADKKLVAQIFGGAGAAIELPEKHFDAVTALSGSGPAFFAYALQAMIEGAAALKLPKDAARFLAEQTLIGTGIYLQNTGRDIAEFIQAVTSPKGTTAAGMAVLEKSSVKAAYAKTLAAAAARSAELSKA
ncbi:MAG TPA: pyrroline-5-carboxylate reductase [Kiritimatiellia bacterium]|nr:pyrroline-5-carboxylate reductase [Kiritimatiellia bacterium]HPS07485.1 pyrroline-5-carboxylate reductase [Kiritimatiellia bacterium]